MITPAMQQAADEIVRFLVASYADRRGIHAETIIGAAAALAGEFALKATTPDLPESGWLFSDPANRLIHGTADGGAPGLWDLLRDGALAAGAPADDLPDPREVAARTAKAVGSSPYPPLSVPDEHYPHEWSPNACPRLRAGIGEIAGRHGLATAEIPLALGRALVMLFGAAKGVLAPAIAATLAVEIMVGVAHMAPLQKPVT